MPPTKPPYWTADIDMELPYSERHALIAVGRQEHIRKSMAKRLAKKEALRRRIAKCKATKEINKLVLALGKTHVS